MSRMSRGGRVTGSGPASPWASTRISVESATTPGMSTSSGRRSATRRGWPRWQRSSPPRRANAAVCPGRSAGSAARVCRVVGLGSDSSSALEAAQPPRLRRRPRAARDRLSGVGAQQPIHVSTRPVLSRRAIVRRLPVAPLVQGEAPAPPRRARHLREARWHAVAEKRRDGPPWPAALIRRRRPLPFGRERRAAAKTGRRRWPSSSSRPRSRRRRRRTAVATTPRPAAAAGASACAARRRLTPAARPNGRAPRPAR